MPIPIFSADSPAQQPGFRMPKIASLLMPAFLIFAAPAQAQPLSPHEKVSEVYKFMSLCPALKVDRKALDRFAMLNGIDLTPGSRDERWFVKRAAYDMRRIPRRNSGYVCKQGMTRYGPEGGIAKGLMLTN
jgi:hypothetical protein